MNGTAAATLRAGECQTVEARHAATVPATTPSFPRKHLRTRRQNPWTPAFEAVTTR